MGRRKKEPGNVHRAAISQAAQRLFMERGIEAASMDDIARAAGYSKATLYVYFKNKEEIVGYLTLESMQKLRDCITDALKLQSSARERYNAVCQALADYQEEFPCYFQTALREINIDFEGGSFLPEEKETFLVGEEINRQLTQFVEDGVRSGEFRPDLAPLPVIFSLWGMLSGLIQLTHSKRDYVQRVLHLSRQEFLSRGFDTLYRALENPGYSGFGHPNAAMFSSVNALKGTERSLPPPR